MARVNYKFDKQQRAANKSRQQEDRRNKRDQRPQIAPRAIAMTENQS